MKDLVDSSSLVFICMLYAFQRVWRDIEIPLQISIQEKGSNKADALPASPGVLCGNVSLVLSSATPGA